MYAWNSQKGVDMFADNSNYVVGELQFVFYSSDDIRRLSVKEILNPQTFDDAQQPLQNGLYDAALGPTEHSEQCATCSLGRLFCPGHMGHIELPVTVYHPLFFDTIFMLLKSSCLGCYHIAVDPKLEHIFINQCRLLDKGRYIAFGEILDLFNHSRDKPKDELFEILDEFTEKALKDDSTWTESHLTRNKKELRNTLVKGLQKKFKTTGKCQNCGMYKKQLRKEHKAKIVVVASTKVVTDVDKKKASENESRQSNDEESDSDTDDDEKPSAVVKAVSDVNFMPPAQVKGILREVWKFHKEMLLRLFPFFENSELEYPTDVFFLETVGVPGNKYRPISEMNDMRFEHTQTANLHRVLNGCVDVREIMQEMRILETQPSVGQKDNRTQKPIITRLSDAMVMLQRQVNITFDQRSDTGIKDAQPGIRQMLESKEGLFRKNIMGKRVNHACRSVISPDPNIATNEIGIPEVFAKSLTFPQPVTPWNVHELRQAVKNGPDKHPGAVSVVNELGQEIMLNFKDKTRREAIAKQLLTPPTTSCKQALLGVKTVNRHLKNGDLLLLNRQPTLHRPSIQGHMARVLKGEKTMRLNYMNCKAYNADFDGDEMSAHFPQSELCRAEAFHIASTDFQYLSPKDGTPLAGLMQDHIVSGVHLSIRGKFFCKEDYCNLVNSAVFDNQGPIKILPPTIWKPYRAYTGKQVISSVILNIIPEDKLKLSFNGKAKVPEKSWLNTKVKQQTPAFMGEGDVVIRQGELLSWLNTKVKQQTPAYMGESDVVIRQGELLSWLNTKVKQQTPAYMGESDVVIRQGELLVGILDKQHLGATSYGLVHCVNELYGGRIAGRLLTCLGRLFLCFLKIRGFTLGVEDILVKDKGDQDRRKIIKKSLKVGTKAAVKAFNLPEDAKPEEIRRAYQDAHFDRDERQLRELDITMRGQTNDVQNSIVNVIMPPGLIKQFPSNNLQLMVKSGSKGSMVNTMQISCLLGQIELEGRRPPLMVSGKTLPSFCAYDISPRAGGFVSDRFLTGVRPQEYFFHCMAGREGLVDTAVKTSRSGYLQRCIIKFLEGIKVAYDSSVRDSDNSIIQFQYGEDGLDVCKACFLNPKQLSFVTENTAGLKKESHQTNDEVETVKKEQKKVSKWKKTNKREKGSRHSDFLEFSKSADVEESETFVPGRNGRAVALCEKWRALSTKKQNKYSKLTKEPDPILSRFWPHQKRVFPEKLYELFLNFSDKNLKQVDKSMSKEDFLELMDAKVKESLAVPGEAVGLVCAQSIGEPSTQMTLNTFHFAGRGEMNMTLGIPRLRELLMTGSKMIKTPAIDVPVRPGKEAKDTVTKLQKWLNRVYLSEVLEEAEVSTWLSFQGQRARMYKIKFKFLHQDCYKQRFSIRPQFTIQAIETKFFKQLVEKIRYRMSKLSEARNLKSNKQQADRPVEPDNDEQFLNEPDMADKPATTNDADADADGSDDNDAAGADADEYSMRLNKKHQDEQEYEDEEELDDDGVAVEMEIDESGTLGVDMEYDRRKRAEPSSDEDEGDVEESLIRMKEARFKVKDSRNKRINTVLLLAKEIVDYKYDFKKHQQCELTLSFPLQDNQLDISTIIKDLAQKTIIHQVPGISKCFLGEQKGEDGMELHLKTEGINIEWVCKHSKVLDLNRLYCNNIYTVEKTYGIEAARNVIIKEMQSVFGAYGIDVNYRHLSLLSDYMTFEGTYKPFTRMTMASNASPLQRMTYETSMQFLMDACINAEVESLNSPSAQITVGKNITCGTGSVDMMVPLTF